MNQAKTRNGAVDLMRLVFCICIVLQHAVYAIPDDTPAILSRGSLGVEFFFLVSGYLLACSAHRYLTDGRPKPSVTSFRSFTVVIVMPKPHASISKISFSG